ncbi:MAG: TIGR02452 family protein [Halofilum sp. (in: g-proteobacteria)]|nr:TIGR02452 family protein [Halofilum sp. (in: g-proteobacteria)]
MNAREAHARLARETVEALTQGGYRLADGRWVSIAEWLAEAKRSTRVFTPDELAALEGETNARTAAPPEIRVLNASTLTAARALTDDTGHEPLCLNFASARNPGGGFLKGAQAQEEALARATGLYACLREAPAYYTANRRCDTTLYTDHMIHTPGVPVFRDDDGNLLAEPYRVSVVSAPAVNRSALKKNEPAMLREARSTMRRRMRRLLALARHQGHRRLVLGAWGCGVFGQEPAHVAADFRDLLTGEGRFAGAFDTVVFAVLDPTPGAPAFEAFRRSFGVVSQEAGST